MNWKNKQNILENTKEYSSKDRAFRGLLGGIGTGNISLDEKGRMCDFEVMNHPHKGNKIPYTFFSLFSQFGEEVPTAMVLEAKPDGISNKALGHPTGELMGLPRFDSCTIQTQYPFYEYAFQKEGLPLEVTMEAVTPFVPLDDVSSGLPAFQVTYKVKNVSTKEGKVSVCGTMYNFTGMYEYDGYDHLYQKGQPVNELVEERDFTGIHFINSCSEKMKQDVSYGSICLATTNKKITSKPCWQFGGWWDGAEEFWQDFAEDGMLCADTESDAVGSLVQAADGARYVGSLAAYETIAPMEEKTFTFYVAWHFPNRYGWWPDGHLQADNKEHLKIWQNYYSTLWGDAKEVLIYFTGHNEELIGHSRNFRDALYSSTLGADVVESLVSAVTVIRSTTCFRIQDGRFFGWEGCFEEAGSCAGTCTHVWNYAQAMAFLFPNLERSARYTEFLEETDGEGRMAFRAKRLLDGKAWDMLPAADGQLGSILRVYREWKLSGNEDFLKKVWRQVLLCMEYSIDTWDPDRDGVMEKVQHNTYDIEFYGKNPLCNSIYLAALRAVSAMAEYMGDAKRSETYQQLAEQGSKHMDEEMFNGSFYQQIISEEGLNKYKYQFGTGCLSDQLLGQELAHLYGLGYVLPKDSVKRAVKAIYDNNFRKNLEKHSSVQRTYAFPDEGGLLLCSWPVGGRPKQPFVYSDEVWTGIEYQVAVHLIYEGYIEEGLEIVTTLRKRYNGERRSPYNEIECGNHYARSMAAWGLLVALSGYECDLTKDEITFAPRIRQEDFTCFYSNGKEWGVFRQYKQEGKTVQQVIPLYKK